LGGLLPKRRNAASAEREAVGITACVVKPDTTAIGYRSFRPPRAALKEETPALGWGSPCGNG